MSFWYKYELPCNLNDKLYNTKLIQGDISITMVYESITGSDEANNIILGQNFLAAWSSIYNLFIYKIKLRLFYVKSDKALWLGQLLHHKSIFVV